MPAVKCLHQESENSTQKSDLHESQLDRLAQRFLSVTRTVGQAGILVADAYYATRTIIVPLLGEGHHLVTRVRWNAVGYEPAPTPKSPKRGRPKKYGDQHRLRDFFKGWHNAVVAQSPVYGEERVTIEYRQAGHQHHWRVRLSLLDDDSICPVERVAPLLTPLR